MRIYTYKKHCLRAGEIVTPDDLETHPDPEGLDYDRHEFASRRTAIWECVEALRALESKHDSQSEHLREMHRSILNHVKNHWRLNDDGNT